MKIPCKDCLMLPTCKHKTAIVCSLVWTWLYKNEEGMAEMNHERFKEMRKYLKECFTIQRG